MNKLVLRYRIAAHLLAVALLWLSGCVRFHPESLSSAQTADSFEARTLNDPELKRFLEKNLGHEFPAWPASFDVSKVVLAALFFHPDMDLARAKWASLQAGKKIAAERPNPTLTVAPAYNTTTAIPSPWLATASLEIPIETAGKRGYRIAEATEISEGARLNLASAAWAVRSRVRQRWVDLFAAREMEALFKDQQSLQKESLRLAENQYDAGAISAFELAQVRIGTENTRFLLRDAERQSAEARVQLADSVGVPVRALDDSNLTFADLDVLPTNFPAESMRREALLSRPDILAALAEYAASQSALQLEIAKQYPDIHLSPGYEFDQGDNKWSIGLGITLPIINQNHGAIAQASAKRSEAAANFMALQAHAIAAIDLALASYQVAVQKAADADSLRVTLLKQEKSLQTMLEAGEISKADLIGLRLQLSASALTRLDAIAKAQQALGLLEDALQEPSGISAAVWEVSPRLPKPSETVAHP
jgi:cobalt-zinc-cadmium efflux system outer membrane protein